ncbi:uncharacterized protein LOC143239544 isoform X1 [Tachypleus tridentatus]|uniref:uncharacterized protein LOC143239544 isoform X1 n=1 Tax=Tachypleus tridentatus TaxID=6853 RepID=UPI003FD2BC8F
MGTKQSTSGHSPRSSSANEACGSPSTTTSNFRILGHGHRTGTSAADARQRARSLSSVLSVNGTSSQPLGIPSDPSVSLGVSDSPNSDTSTPDDTSSFSRVFAAHSLPAQLMSFNGIKCPVCSRFVIPEDVEYHLVICLTKPRINYNEDILSEDKGECVICFEELVQGDTIARLPCLCIYHKVCIDAWFKVNRSCPEHPNN